MGFEITDIGKGSCRVRLPGKAEFLRPGGTVNGPALMGLALACERETDPPGGGGGGL